MAVIFARACAIIIFALADIPHGPCLTDINILPQILDIREALGGIVEQHPHWFLEHECEPQLAADHRIVLGVIRTQRVRADQLSQRSRFVRSRRAHGPHLMEHDGNAPCGELPGGFTPRKSAADNMDRLVVHERKLGALLRK